MSVTKYLILARYYNSTTNVCITNTAKEVWFDYKSSSKERFSIGEVFEISKSIGNNIDIEQQKKIIDGTRRDNPKYDMIFCANGVDTVGTGASYVISDMFQRINVDPWFFNSIHSSLESAMTKARDIIDYIGIENVIIGKEVQLDQYITIV